jgi:hypothetical protein
MEKTLETTLGILQNSEDGMDFAELTRSVSARARVDEASAKASILRLNFEGEIRIDSNWVVTMDPAELPAEDSKRVAQSAAA